jgi:cytochrome c oxidase subunit II
VRRGSIFQLVMIGVVAGAIATCVAVFVPWLPTPASRQAGRIDFVYWFATWISLVIFSVVVAIMVYAMINFRAASPDDWSDGPPVHGNTKIEIIWTIIPALLVTSVAIVSAIVLAENGKAGTNPLVVKVTAEQFFWQFTYPNRKTYPILRLPVNRPVKLEITADDVIHSFWVAQFGQKQDAVPGQTNELVITPDRTGTYAVICTELCGLGHALMRSQAVVMDATAYNHWYASTVSAPTPPTTGGGTAIATAVFKNNGCSACHTFRAIPGATGTVGPSLDDLSASAKAAGKPLPAFIKQSIVDPNAVITKGYQPNVMPQDFGTTMTATQINALVAYLAANTK